MRIQSRHVAIIQGALVCSVLLSGCGLGVFADPKTNPVIVNYAGFPVGDKGTVAFALTSERRMMLVRTSDGKACAEPSPDSAENISSQIKLALEAQVKEPKAEGSGRFDFAKDLLTSVQQLFRRTQGVQLFRDGAFAICQQYLNGVLSKEEYARQLTQLLTQSEKLIALELNATSGVVGGPPPSILPVLASSDGTGKQSLTSSDFTRGMQLASNLRRAVAIIRDSKVSQPQKDRAKTEAKIALKQVFVLLQPNAKAIKDKHGSGPTLSDSEFDTLLNEVRGQANPDEQPNLATPDDVASLADVGSFVAKFPVT